MFVNVNVFERHHMILGYDQHNVYNSLIPNYLDHYTWRKG